MNRKGLAILMRTRMKPSSSDLTRISQSIISPTTEEATMALDNPKVKQSDVDNRRDFLNFKELEQVRDLMSTAISINETNNLDVVLDNFSEGYHSLSVENRQKLLLALAYEYDLDRAHVSELMKQYLGLGVPNGDEGRGLVEEEGILSTLYRMENNLRQALKPKYEVLFQRLNTHPGGLKFLTILRADILSFIK